MKRFWNSCNSKMFGKRQKLKYEAVGSQEEEIDLEPVKRKVFTPYCLWSSFGTSLLILTYFLPSIGLTFYQRWLFQSFHFPLITVLIHMAVKFLLACSIRTILSHKQTKPRVILTWKEHVIQVAPTGIFSGIDISFSNWGLELITVSLYTMTKSTTIIFILVFAILFKLERKSWSLTMIVVMISVGLLLFTYKATQFNTLGFILVLLASVSSGVRWTCVQLLLQKSKMGMRNPIDMIYHMQPWMIVSVIPFALWIEGPTVIKNCQVFRFSEYGPFLYLMCKVLIGAFIAFFMELCEVMVVTYTSSLTLSVAGIFKEVFILVLAVQWNGDKMSRINAIGLLICLCGIISHVIHKLNSMPLNNGKRGYDFDTERHELGAYLIDETPDQYNFNNDSETERSDTEVLFDILNKHDR